MKQRPGNDHDAIVEIWEGIFSANGLAKQMSNHLQHHLTTNKLWIALGMLLIGQAVIPIVIKLALG